MKTIIASLILATSIQLFVRGSGFSGGHSYSPRYTHSYTTKRGTYIAPHYSSHPDKNKNNNWSKQGNVNPYTGKRGTK